MAGTVIALEPGTALSIGRDQNSGIPLAGDTTVSRKHARVETRDGGFAVVDEGSSNGTFVNGARTPERVLQPGDEIQIGAARFRFER